MSTQPFASNAALDAIIKRHLERANPERPRQTTPTIISLSDSDSDGNGDNDSNSDDDRGSDSDHDPPPTHTLDEAIVGATESRIRELLRQMCKDNEVCRELASRALLVSVDDTSVANADTKTTKRSRKAYEICVNCEEEYDVLDNHRGYCIYHPGQLPPDP
jgi:hypothetical protein